MGISSSSESEIQFRRRTHRLAIIGNNVRLRKAQLLAATDMM